MVKVYLLRLAIAFFISGAILVFFPIPVTYLGLALLLAGFIIGAILNYRG